MIRFSKWMAPAILVGACVSSLATAQVTYDWSWNGDGDVGSGTLTTNAAVTSTTIEQVTTFSGTWDGAAITGLSGYNYADNILAGGSQPLSSSGLSFVAAGVAWNIEEFHLGRNLSETYSSAGTVHETYSYAFQYSPAPASPTAAPEIDPATATSGFMLLVGGLLVVRGGRQQPLAA